MKSLSAFLGLALTATIAAGCSNGSSGAASSFVPGTRSVATSGGEFSIDGKAACKKTGGCHAKLMIPLTLSGRSLSFGKMGSCRNVSLGSAKVFTAPGTHHFTLKSSVTLPPSCARFAGANAALFIAVAELRSGSRTTPLTPLAGPVNPKSRPWTFTPVSTGVAMKANARFVFFVVAVPSEETAPTPAPDAPSGTFRLLAPMNFDGTSFTETAECSNNVQDAPVYTATADGPLTLAAAVSVSPTCAPDGGDAVNRQLYIVALQPNQSGSEGDSRTVRPHEDGGVPAIAVAGPVNAADNPWSFAPDAPGLMMQAGTRYAFFIAAMVPAAPATPAPPQSYRAIAPLNFDGTNFSISSNASCDDFAAPASYTAPATAPLPLTGPVSIAPTCSPSSTQLYIVATVADFESDAAVKARPAEDGGGGGESIDGVAIAGPVTSTDAQWNFMPLSPALTLTQGLQYRFYVATRK